MRDLLQLRTLIALGLATMAGAVGLRLYPLPIEDPLLALIGARTPWLFGTLAYLYSLLWFSTPFIAFSLVLNAAYVVALQLRTPPTFNPLPPYPGGPDRPELSLVIGEQHHPTKLRRIASPSWLVIPRRGLHCGVLIVGAIGGGKTSGLIRPALDQILGWHADIPEDRVGGLIIEVKGSLKDHVLDILRSHNREEDYVEIGLNSMYCYNPLHNDLDPYSAAFTMASLNAQIWGRSKEPFWAQAYTMLVASIIRLRRLLDGYTTLAEVYEYALDGRLVERDLQRAERSLETQAPRLRVSAHDYHLTCARSAWTDWLNDVGDTYVHVHSAELVAFLEQNEVPYTSVNADEIEPQVWKDRRHQLEALRLWYYHDWMELDSRLQTSIKEGLTVFLANFRANPQLTRGFCPPRELYLHPQPGATHGTPLPPLDALIEEGRVLMASMPIALDPGLARTLNVLIKMNYQRAVLARIPKMAAEPGRRFRDALLAIDECHQVITTGGTDPSGDEHTLSLSREARLIPVFATQSLTSLRAATHDEHGWRVILGCLRTRIALAAADDFTAATFAELCGQVERLKPSYQLTEASQDAGVSYLTGRSASRRSTITAAITYSLHWEHKFKAKDFAELPNNVGIVTAYDGKKPHAARLVLLKPYFEPVQTSFFDTSEEASS